MSKQKQFSFFKSPKSNTKIGWITKQHVYGGELNYRKVRRPFDSKRLIHVVFKANLSGSILFTRSHKSITTLINSIARRYGVRIKSMAVNTNHIHLLIWCGSRESMTRFLRLVPAELARKYLAIFARFGLQWPNKFWLHRPFSRIVEWGKKSLKQILEYIKLNRDEAAGIVPKRARNHPLNRFLESWPVGAHVGS